MKYRVMIDLSFDTLAEAQTFLNVVKTGVGKRILNSATGELEGNGNLHKCYHDETPTKPCEIIEEVYK